MHRRPVFRAFALCLALLPLACAQQLNDGLVGDDAEVTVDAGELPADVGEKKDVQAPPKDDGVAVAEDVPPVDPPDAGFPEDVPTAPEDVGFDVGFDLGGSTDTGAPVDLGGPVDLGTPDTGPRCVAPVVDCGGACVNLQTSAANCGGCGRTCATGQSCVAGACALVCTAPTVVCGGACVNTQTNAAHCGMCGRACAASATCMAGRCVGGVIPGSTFQVSLSANRCSTADHDPITGDDRGGIAVTNNRLFYSGDTSTGRFDLQSLAGEPVGRVYDGLVSNLATGTLYALANGSTPLTQAGGTVTSLVVLDSTTGGLTSGLVALSQPIDLPATGSVGIFSGYERIILLGGGRAWHISLPSGAVLDLGAVAMPATRTACENWAIWGVAEFFGGALYVDYVQSATTIARMRLPDGVVTTLASFTALSDMCSFTVSPLWRRWYFHHELTSQFRSGGSEVVGYCDATITGPTLPCRPTDTTCGGACTDLQTSAANCGACGRACAAGQSCTAGVCGFSCAPGRTPCAGVCVDLGTDTANCGACGRACTGTQWCNAGACGGGSSYTVDATPTVAFIDACTAGGSQRVLTFADDSTASTTLPFATRWWGAALTEGTPMSISSNGFVQVNTASGLSSLSGTIPSTSTPNGVIAPQWTDLVMSGSGVCIATVGTVSARRWVVQWVGAQYYLGAGSNLNFELIVHEGSGIIEFAYAAMTGSSTATVGIENPAGTVAFGPCGAGNSCAATSNLRARFTPSP